MVIRDVAPGVTTLSIPFLRFGRIKFGGRATIGTHPQLAHPFFPSNPYPLSDVLQCGTRSLMYRPHPR
jgi:hypothetical protein